MLTQKEINQMVKKMPKAQKPPTSNSATAQIPAPKKAKAIKLPIAEPPSYVTEDDDNYVPVGIGGLLASTEKLLAVNRGLADPDERDSYVYKQMFGVDRHLSQRIKLDAGRIRYNLMRNASRIRTLRAAHPFMFDGYSSGLVIGDPSQANPLSSPLEEINPLHILEQQRRVTQMGPGGIGSSEAITPDAQAVHPSQFGFISAIEGPESERIGIDTRLAWGTRFGSDGRLYQQFKNRRTGEMDWVSPEDLEGKVVALPN